MLQLEVTRGVGIIALTNFGDASGVGDRILEELEKTGALKNYVTHPEPSPNLEPVMARFLAVYNQWNATAMAGLLSRPLGPDEQEELSGYKALHGTCSKAVLGEVTSPTSAHFALTCERGVLDLQLDLTPGGKLDGFVGTSTNITVPPAVTTGIADAIAKRADLGACTTKEIEHYGTSWRAALACASGPMLLDADAKLSRFEIHQVRDSRCPTR